VPPRPNGRKSGHATTDALADRDAAARAAAAAAKETQVGLLNS